MLCKWIGLGAFKVEGRKEIWSFGFIYILLGSNLYLRNRGSFKNHVEKILDIFNSPPLPPGSLLVRVRRVQLHPSVWGNGWMHPTIFRPDTSFRLFVWFFLLLAKSCTLQLKSLTRVKYSYHQFQEKKSLKGSIWNRECIFFTAPRIRLKCGKLIIPEIIKSSEVSNHACRTMPDSIRGLLKTMLTRGCR